MILPSGLKSILNMVSESDGEVSISISAAVDAGIVRHGTVGYFIAMTYDF